MLACAAAIPSVPNERDIAGRVGRADAGGSVPKDTVVKNRGRHCAQPNEPYSGLPCTKPPPLLSQNLLGRISRAPDCALHRPTATVPPNDTRTRCPPDRLTPKATAPHHSDNTAATLFDSSQCSPDHLRLCIHKLPAPCLIRSCNNISGSSEHPWPPMYSPCVLHTIPENGPSGLVRSAVPRPSDASNIIIKYMYKY